MQYNSNLPARKLSGLRPEPPLWQGNPVQYLINDKYPLNYLLKLQHLPEQTSKLDEATIQAIAMYRKELEAKTQEELAPLIHDARKREAERIRQHEEKKDAEAFFSLASANADFGYWSRISYWTLEEAVALSLGKNPKIVNSEKLRVHSGNSPFIATYSAKLEEVRRAKVMGQIWESTIPNLFVAWSERIAFEMPSELVQRVKALGSHVVDWKMAYENQVKEANGLRSDLLTSNQQVIDARDEHLHSLRKISADNKEIAEGHEKLIAMKDQRIAVQAARIEKLERASLESSKIKIGEIGPRERDSLLKLVLGMAIGGYGYDPKAPKSKQTKAIADDLRIRGIPLDEGTVLKFLTQAKTEFADKLTE